MAVEFATLGGLVYENFFRQYHSEKMTYLNLSDCKNLEVFNLICPSLKKLIVENCGKFVGLEELKEITLKKR